MLIRDVGEPSAIEQSLETEKTLRLILSRNIFATLYFICQEHLPSEM